MSARYPLKVKSGSVTVTVYKNRPASGYTSFTVSYFIGDERRRQVFSNEEDARTHANEVADKLATGTVNVRMLTPEEQGVYSRATDAVRDTGLALDHAAKEFGEAKSIVGTVSLVEVARFWRDHGPRALNLKTAGEVVEEFLARKRDKGRSDVHLKDLRLRLQKFADTFRCPLNNVSVSEIDAYLSRLDVGPRTQNNHRAIIGSLFKYAQSRDYVAHSHKGVSTIDEVSIVDDEVEIFTPDDLIKLLRQSRRELIPFLALGAFAGLRTAELTRLDWAEIDTDGGWINLPARKSKLRQSRLIPIRDNLRKWLEGHQRVNGRVVPFDSLSKQVARVAKDAGVRWVRNGPRHSHISYAVALSNNLGEVAEHCGTSAPMIRQHYLKRVKPEQAKEWFSLVP